MVHSSGQRAAPRDGLRAAAAFLAYRTIVRARQVRCAVAFESFKMQLQAQQDALLAVAAAQSLQPSERRTEMQDGEACARQVACAA